jgi:hypothetical protein
MKPTLLVQDLHIPEDFYVVPLYKKDGSISDYAMVSVGDYHRVMQYKWRKGDKFDYARLCLRPGGRKGKLVTVLMHRFILGLPSYRDGNIADHINGNRLDNRRSNLRITTHSVNCQNAKRRSDNTSGYRGIAWSQQHRKWRVRFQKDGKGIEVGCFNDLADAILARDAAIKDEYNYYVRFA